MTAAIPKSEKAKRRSSMPMTAEFSAITFRKSDATMMRIPGESTSPTIDMMTCSRRVSLEKRMIVSQMTKKTSDTIRKDDIVLSFYNVQELGQAVRDMYTGIIQALCPVVKLDEESGLKRFVVELPDRLVVGLTTGASVALDEVCLTVTRIE